MARLWLRLTHAAYRRGESDPRSMKEELVRAGQAHAALVLDEQRRAQGWCQYGSPEELLLRYGRQYRKDPPPPPAWRITCIFVDRRHPGHGIARAALGGAFDQIAVAGGGPVEAISETTAGREAQGRFLFSGTVELFEPAFATRCRRFRAGARHGARAMGTEALGGTIGPFCCQVACAIMG